MPESTAPKRRYTHTDLGDLELIEWLLALVHLRVVDPVLVPLAVRLEYAVLVTGLNRQAFARAATIGSSTVTQYLNGTQPKGDPTNLDASALAVLAKVARCAQHGIRLPWLAYGSFRPASWADVAQRIAWAVQAAAPTFKGASQDNGKYQTESCLAAFPGIFDRAWFESGEVSPPAGVQARVQELQERGCVGLVGESVRIELDAEDLTALRRLINRHANEVPATVHAVLAQAVAEQTWSCSREQLDQMTDVERERYFTRGRHQLLGSAVYEMTLAQQRALSVQVVNEVLAAWALGGRTP